MSEHSPHDEHYVIHQDAESNSLIVVVLAFVVPVILIRSSRVSRRAASTPGATAASDEAIAKRLKPVGEVVVAEGSDVPGQRSGKQIVEAVCAACPRTAR